MINWFSKEEMGSGFQYNEEDHEKFSYNSLLTVKPEEKSTMRTCYLVRDCWNDDQIVKLRDYINSIIESRKE